MSKLTQKELLLEGFLDVVRAAGRAIGKGAVRGTGGLVGGVAGGLGKAALQVGKDIATAHTGATLSNVARQGVSGVTGGARLGASVAAKVQEAITGKEEAALRRELETNYRDVFQTISLKIGRGKPDPTNMNIMIIPFIARKIGDSMIKSNNSINLSKATNKLENLLKIPGMAGIFNTAFGTQFVQGETNKPGNRFMSPVTQFITNLEKSKEGLFYGYVKKTGIKEKPYEIAIKDINEQTITGNKSQKDNTLPKFDTLFTKIPQFNPNNSNAIQWSRALLRGLGKGREQEYRDIIDAVIPAAKGNNTYVLTPTDIAQLKRSLKDDYMLISEKNTQINLVRQLTLLNDSYNHIYELSKHKNN